MFDYIDYIKAVNDCGSFTKAAEKLFITQPALSLAVRKAEEELGTALFDRRCKPVRLTEEGKLYMEAAHQVQMIHRQLKDQLDMNIRQVSGTLRVGAAGISMNYLIPDILDRFRENYPDVKVEITEESFYTLKELLRNEEIDIMVDTEFSDPDFSSERLFQNTVLYAIPEQLIQDKALLRTGFTAEDINAGRFRLPGSPRITMQDVCDIPFLSLQARNELQSRAERYFYVYQCRPKTIMNFNQQMTAYRFAQRGYGATFVADTLVRYNPLPGIRFYIFDYRDTERWISVSYKKEHYLTNASKAFIELAKAVFA